MAHSGTSVSRSRRGQRRSETAFGVRNGAGSAWIKLGSHAQRAAKRLEYRFALMVRILAAQVVDVQRHIRVIDETLKRRDLISVELSYY